MTHTRLRRMALRRAIRAEHRAILAYRAARRTAERAAMLAARTA